MKWSPRFASSMRTKTPALPSSLALATALVRPKKLLVMDEPEQRLDVEGVAWLGARLKHEMTKGLAIVMASHEPSLVNALGARVVRLGAAAETSESQVEAEF